MNCLLDIFSFVWILISTKLWGFSCYLIRNMFDLLVVDFMHLTPYVHFSWLAHALHTASYCTHTPLLPLPCLGQYLVFTSLVCHIYFMLCSILFLRYFVFCLNFISHSSYASYASISLFVSSFLSLLLLGPFVYS